MTRNRLLFFILSLALVLPIASATFVAAAARSDDGRTDSFYKYLTVFTEVLTRVRQSYVEEVDPEELFQGALEGTTDALDPFSVYVPPEAVDGYLAARQVGIAHSGMLVLKERGVIYVVGIQPGSPAETAGIEVGDIVAEIDGTSTRTMPLWQAQQIFAGEAGREIGLELVRLRERHQVTLELGPFEPPHPSLRYEREVPVLRIPRFRGDTAEEVEALLAEVEGDRLLVDVRGVAAGDADAAYAVAGLFVRGELGTLSRRGETLATFSGGEAPRWQGSMVVLTDRGTLGPAELLATMLRERLSAHLVGERTFGYAGRQTLRELAAGGRLLITDAFYTGPDGEPLRESLQPDLRVDYYSRSLAESEEPLSDLILERGLGLLLGEEELPADHKAA